MPAHGKTPYSTISMDFSSGKGVVRGRRGQQLGFALLLESHTARGAEAKHEAGIARAHRCMQTQSATRQHLGRRMGRKAAGAVSHLFVVLLLNGTELNRTEQGVVGLNVHGGAKYIYV